MASKRILVVDDEIGIRELLQDILQDEGYHVQLAENAAAARALRLEARPEVVLLDIWMPDCDGITLLKEWSSSGLLTMPVIMMSGHGTIDTAVEATRIGAFDFLEKPIALQKLLKTVSAALKHSEASPKPAMTLLHLGKSQIILALKDRLERINANSVIQPVLLVGQAGAGAKICAKFLHHADTPWLTLTDVYQLTHAPLELLASLRDGLLFIDEVAALNIEAQKSLLLLLTKAEKFSVRVVCNTTQDLGKLQLNGQFDHNLLQMLSSITVTLPNLDAHKEDIPDLVLAIANLYFETQNLHYKEFETAALNALRNAAWPGNLMQLHTVVSDLIQTSVNEKITLDDVRRIMYQHHGLAQSLSYIAVNDPADVEDVAQNGIKLPNLAQHLRDAREDFERIYFVHHLAQAGYNMSKLAEISGLERTHLYRKLKQLGIKIK
jgi:two-component system, NtrC family, nitrogen regulation response regulator NtrX